jgi:hypothetical protein
MSRITNEVTYEDVENCNNHLEAEHDIGAKTVTFRFIEGDAAVLYGDEARDLANWILATVPECEDEGEAAE